jgi:HD-GYP domain-containing protein (c-di-GMP phosphodiesterase class II)
MSSTIAVEELHVGMYIQLEGGWLSHPFPLSSFRITSLDQIETLRSLGLSRVRWVPEKSDLAGEAADSKTASAGSSPNASIGRIQAPDAPAATAAASPLTPQTHATQQHQQWLATQREAALRCERQYGEAAIAWRAMNDEVVAAPQQAGRTGLALTRAMLDKMLGSDEIGIRLIGGGPDRAAAHALNVTVVSLLIGRTLNLGEAEMTDLGVGALLHDVGKLDVAERLRHEEQGFTAAEIAAYRDHVAKGVAHGQRMLLAPGALAVLAQHHEHADGSGFPHKLGADRMAIAARIVAIVNRYDNLCNPGSRTIALTPHEAVAMLFAQGRARYDAPVLNAFIRMMGVYPAGSLVQLTDDRFAMVVGVNSNRPLKPRVLVHGTPRAAVARGRCAVQPPASSGAELLDLETTPDLGIRRSLGAAKLPPAALQALDPRPRVSYYFEPLGPVGEQQAQVEQAA